MTIGAQQSTTADPLSCYCVDAMGRWIATPLPKNRIDILQPGLTKPT